VRIEDTDTPRCIPGAAQDILQTLKAFGLHWDGDVIWQHQRTHLYQRALDDLAARQVTFACACTRREIDLLQGRPHRGQGQHYPGTCRGGLPTGKPARAVRFSSNGQTVQWQEAGEGLQCVNLESDSGDFVIHRADGLWAYQLAVVVDDREQGITHVVRGADLKDSTARQVALFGALGAQQGDIPRYWHLPLVLNEHGEKLSKQAGAKALVTADAVGELNAAWRVFGLPALAADTPGQWLDKALPRWAAYSQQHSQGQQGGD
jgi:glutamyl-Q tRNA(Asp) synthetase